MVAGFRPETGAKGHSRLLRMPIPDRPLPTLQNLSRAEWGRSHGQRGNGLAPGRWPGSRAMARRPEGGPCPTPLTDR